MKVYISPQCHAQIMFYVMKSSVEISGLGRIQKTSNGSMVVTSVYLLKQENAAASTDIDPEAMAELLFESRNDPGDLNFWWHSHVDMGVFWSGTDMGTIQDFGRKGYLLATVFNKKGEYRTAYLQGAGAFLPEVFVDDIDTEFGYLPSSEERNKWLENYETLCKEKKWEPVNQYSGPKRSLTRGAHGIGSQGGDVPLSHSDPHYYQTEGFQNTPAQRILQNGILDEIVGRHTGYTTREMVQEIRKLRKLAPDKLDDLDMTSRFMLWDLFEILNGFEVDSESEMDEMNYLIAMITETQEEFEDFLDDFWDSVQTFDMDKAKPGPIDTVLDKQKRDEFEKVQATTQRKVKVISP